MTEFTQSSRRGRDQDCPECGERIPASALVCPECDARLVDDDDDDRRLERRVTRRREASYRPHNGQMIMVLGIISFVFMPHILGPVSWIMGYMDLKKIRKGEMDPEGESQTRTGMICGMISTILHAVILVVVIGLFAVFVGGGICCFGAAATAPKGGGGTTNPPANTQPK